MAVLIVSTGYAYAQFRQDFFGGVLRGEQGDPAELPPQSWPDDGYALGINILLYAMTH